MAQNKIISGVRAQVFIEGRLVGIFNNCSYGFSINVAPAFVLGRASPAELTNVGVDAVEVRCAGWRVRDNGPHVNGVPHIQDLLTADDITITLHDRLAPASAPALMTVIGCRSTGYTTSVTQKQQQEITVTFLGLTISDEAGVNAEPQDASSI